MTTIPTLSDSKIMGMGRQKFLAVTGILFAFLVCAINFSMLARRTIGGVSSASGSGNNIGSSPELEFHHVNETIPKKETNTPPPSSEKVSCLRARKDILPPSLYGNLGLPFINLGFPQMGTYSIHAFFGCAGYKSHYRCQNDTTCAKCAVQSAMAGLPPLAQCMDAEVYSQLEGEIPQSNMPGGNLYFPQIELLNELVQGYPNATFLLTFRSMENWYHSISNWPPSDGVNLKLKDQIGLSYQSITKIPPVEGESMEEFSEFFCNHVKRVRAIVPQNRLVEIDIEDPTTSSRMADIFDIDEECWGRANVNANLHPELNQTMGGMKLIFQGRTMLRGKNGVMRNTTEHIIQTQAKASDITINKSITDPPKQSINTGDSTRSTSWSDSCEQLIAHENGHWHHQYQSENNGNTTFLDDNPSIFQMHFPQELMWMAGRDMPQNFGTCTRNNKYLMYNSLLGHQCGCGMTGFAPSHSVWVHNKTNATPAAEAPPKIDYFASSPTLRLARQLANLKEGDGTLCFSGDSIDYQIYAAFHNNLRRIDQLHQLHNPGEERLVSVVTREIPVTQKYHTKPGKVDDWFLHGHRPPDGDGSFLNANRPPPNGFGSMYSILETKAYFSGTQSNGEPKRARIRYYMSYGWSPWNVDLMEDCNVNIMNMGLHYKPDGDHMGKETRHTLMDDMLAAITYLTNFTASGDNRVAVWRSALPQHFSTHDGHFRGWKNLNGSCSAIGEGNGQQAYNRAYDEAFMKLCQPEQQVDDSSKQSCDHLRHKCTVNPAAEVDYQTIYKFWRDNNCTEHIENEQLRLSNLSSIADKQASVTGEIFRWSIYDLFDVVNWHSKDLDCSHVCYVPQLFEAAFERLELLVSPLLASS